MDSESLGRLVDRHAAALALYARQWCANPEDVVQEAFLKLTEQSTPPADPSAWLFRVVRHGALNAAVAARRRRRYETEAGAGSSCWFQSESALTTPRALDAETATDELRQLPLDEREVIVARIWGGLTFEQIAEISGCSSSTAHRLYCSGLTRLRERLGVTCRSSRSTQK